MFVHQIPRHVSRQNVRPILGRNYAGQTFRQNIQTCAPLNDPIYSFSKANVSCKNSNQRHHLLFHTLTQSKTSPHIHTQTNGLIPRVFFLKKSNKIIAPPLQAIALKIYRTRPGIYSSARQQLYLPQSPSLSLSPSSQKIIHQHQNTNQDKC